MLPICTTGVSVHLLTSPPHGHEGRSAYFASKIRRAIGQVRERLVAVRADDAERLRDDRDALLDPQAFAREARPGAMAVVVLAADRVRAAIARLTREVGTNALHVVDGEVGERVAAVRPRPAERGGRLSVAEHLDARDEREHLGPGGHRDVVHHRELGMALHEHASLDRLLPGHAVPELPQAALDEGMDVDVLDVILWRATRPHRHVRKAARPQRRAVARPGAERELARGAPVHQRRRAPRGHAVDRCGGQTVGRLEPVRPIRVAAAELLTCARDEADAQRLEHGHAVPEDVRESARAAPEQQEDVDGAIRLDRGGHPAHLVLRHEEVRRLLLRLVHGGDGRLVAARSLRG